MLQRSTLGFASHPHEWHNKPGHGIITGVGGECSANGMMILPCPDSFKWKCIGSEVSITFCRHQSDHRYICVINYTSYPNHHSQRYILFGPIFYLYLPNISQRLLSDTN
jgi:hypothetical protein